MKQSLFILFNIIFIRLYCQDSLNKYVNFNYCEISLISNTVYNVFENKTNSINSLNLGCKLNHHKLSIGVEFNPLYIIGWSEAPSHYYTKKEVFVPNIKANYYFYFSKRQKQAGSFLFLNYNTQQIKDYINETDYELKRANAYGLGYGISFYIKNRFLIEPSFLINTTWFKDKDVNEYRNLYSTTYITSIYQGYIIHTGIGLKIGYIINLKHK